MDSCKAQIQSPHQFSFSRGGGDILGKLKSKVLTNFQFQGGILGKFRPEFPMSSIRSSNPGVCMCVCVWRGGGGLFLVNQE